jgi:hypothetical protein
VARLSLRLSLVSALALAVACGFTSAPAKADVLPILFGGNCGATQQPFAQFGDTHSYYFTSNGGFESGSTGWSLGYGAKVASGNETFYAHGTADRSSLLIPNGVRVTSPSLCFGTFYPGARFFARSPSGSGTIHVRLVTRSLLGILSILDGGTIAVGPDWAPTSRIGTLWSQVAVLGGAKSVQLELTASGDVQIDDVYIDPLLQDC